jgi:hypothetical protein
MGALKHPIFIIASLLFLGNYSLEIAGYSIPGVHAYMDDLLCLPVVLTLVLSVFQKLRSPSFTFQASHIIFAALYFAFAFEWLLPKYSPAYVSDPWDVLCYSLGALVFYVFQNRSQEKIEKNFQSHPTL